MFFKVFIFFSIGGLFKVVVLVGYVIIIYNYCFMLFRVDLLDMRLEYVILFVVFVDFYN